MVECLFARLIKVIRTNLWPLSNLQSLNMASLTGLSNELKLMVIECLLELPESSNTTISDASSNGDKDMSDAETKKGSKNPKKIGMRHCMLICCD